VVDENKCPSLDQLLVALDEVPLQDEGALATHLQSCPACREKVARVQAILAAGGAMLDAELSSVLTSTSEERYAAFLARLQREEDAPRMAVHLRRGRRWLWAAVVALVLSGAAISRTAAAEAFFQHVVMIVRTIWSGSAPPARGGASTDLPAQDRPLPTSAAPAPSSVDLDPIELAVWSRLRAADADLAGHVRVTREAETIRVQGAVLPAALQPLRTQLQALPHVRTTLRRRKAQAPAVPVQAFADWLDRHLAADSANRQTFVSTLHARVRTVDEHLARLVALRRFVRTGSADGQATLRHLLNAHAEVLDRDLQALDLQVAKLPFVIASRCAATTGVPSVWPSRAVAAGQQAHALRTQLDRLLAQPIAATEDLSTFATMFDALWDAWYCPTVDAPGAR